jgi:hypothetical protein
MSKKAPIAIASANLVDHPAARAWKSIGCGSEPAIVELWREAGLTKPAIYRLTFARPQRPGVFAKRYFKTSPEIERKVYEEILPHLPLTLPRYYGYCQDHDGSAWLFVEDVGAERLSPRDPDQRVLAGRWLGVLHRSGADLPAAARLPDAGPSRYLGHLRSGRARIRLRAGNPGLTTEGRAMLSVILELHDALESRWREFEKACEGLPATLVHGDFRPKNVRICTGDAALYPIDWEMAGWGVPAADLAPARDLGMTMQVDPHSYETVMRERWPDLDAAAIKKLSILGHIFRALAGIEWESESLRFELPNYLTKPVSSMRSFARKINDGLEAGAEFLR